MIRTGEIWNKARDMNYYMYYIQYIIRYCIIFSFFMILASYKGRVHTRVQRIWLFLETEEHRPFDGCNIEIRDTFTKIRFSRFLHVWLQSF